MYAILDVPVCDNRTINRNQQLQSNMPGIPYGAY